MSYTMICAISYILGIYVAREVSISYVLIFAVVGICVAIIKGIVSKELNLSVILAVFMLSAGISLYKISAYNELYDKFPDEMVTITGTIVSAPEKDDGEYYNKYILAPETIALGEQSVKSDKNIIIRIIIFFIFNYMFNIFYNEKTTIDSVVLYFFYQISNTFRCSKSFSINLRRINYYSFIF